MNDEKAIRSLIDTWLAASKVGDTETVLNLMTNDVIFMVPGQEPFGKEAFKKASEHMKTLRIEAESEIKELKILGDWAYLRNLLTMKITPPNGQTVTQSGYNLTILRKENGTWLLCRDANLLAKI